MIDGAFASASSTVCPSTPGAPLLRTTFSSARARLASDATSSSSRLVSATPVPGPLVFLLLALCSRKPRRSDASEDLAVPPPEGLSANTRFNCRGPVFLNPSLPLLDRLSPASLLIRRDPTSAWASTRRRCLLQVYRSRGPTQISLGKNTGCPAAPAPITASASVGFWASRSKTRSPGRSGLLRSSLSFGATVCLGLLPHTASRRQQIAVSRRRSTACSCLWLAVATNSPREGLTPPIQCPCQAHLRCASAGDLPLSGGGIKKDSARVRARVPSASPRAAARGSTPAACPWHRPARASTRRHTR